MIVLAFYLIIVFASSCKISGKQSGYCISNPLDAQSFCGSQIGSYVCVPAHNSTWSQYDASYKDRIVQQNFMNFFQQQLMDEYINSNTTLMITNNPSCYNAYWQFLCRWNFPSCNVDNTSRPTCASVCNNLYASCGGSSDACSIIYSGPRP